MSAHYSKFSLNTYQATPYFQAHLPAGYPLDAVLQKCRAFRRLPPRLRHLAGLAKRWAVRTHDAADSPEIRQWYDAEGHELDPGTGRRLSDQQIDADWSRWPSPDIEVEDIPDPPGGFPDPDTWEAPRQPDEEGDDTDGLTEDRLVDEIQSHGRARVGRTYGLSAEETARAPSDSALAQAILAKRGKRQ